MSDFRPVREVWGAHSATFVDSNELLRMLCIIADELESETRAGSGDFRYEEKTYSDVTVFWVNDGKRFLEAVKALGDNDFEEYGVDYSEDAASNPAVCLIQNMKALADQWIAESLGTDGSLRLYIDE